jgi:ParB family transcriptional regulator, chromosome partitioning protein
MARKISFDEAPEDTDTTIEQRTSRATSVRPLLGLPREAQPPAALGMISRSLGEMTEKAKRADAIEQQLVQGFTVVELEPSIVDGSFVPDRMMSAEDGFSTFLEIIRTQGQASPILVRPHSADQGRYQVAFGHRRLRAARELGVKVKAVVRALSDEELVVAQGQENSARSDLTYIERARFAAQLEERGFSRDVIMQSLNLDKAALSKLIAIATRIPLTIIDAIGPAPGFGRQRWAELAEMLEIEMAMANANLLLEKGAFQALTSDKRFLQLYEAMKAKPARSLPEVWTAKDGTRAAQVQRNGKKLTLVFDERTTPAFGEYVRMRLQTLFDEYKKLGEV